MRAGRKRKNGERYPSGKLRPSAEELERRMTPRKAEVIDPTPETMARRVAVFGCAPKPGQQQGELASVLNYLPLTVEQRWAAEYAVSAYARFVIAIRAPRVTTGNLSDYVEGGGGSPWSDEQAISAVKAYQDMTLAIRRYSFRSLKEVERVMHGSLPRNFDALAVGLTALADHLGFEEQRAA